MALESEELGRLLVAATAVTTEVVLVLTREGVVLHANDTARRLLGEGTEGQALPEMVDALSSERVNDAIARASDGRPVLLEATFPGPLSIDFLFVPAGDEPLRLLARGRERALAPEVRDRLGELNRRYDEKVRELASLTGKLRELATTDPLTNLFNRRAFLDRAEAEWARAKRHGTPLSCVVIDIDHFKLINDRYGHATGDEVLRLFGSLLRTTVRTSDLPARLGGEEFVALLPQTGEGGAALLAERVRARVADHPVVTAAGELVRATCSVGVASSEHGYASFTELLSAADAALYGAKQQGRDRVVEASLMRPTIATG